MASEFSSLYMGSDELTLECDACKYLNITSQAVSYCEVCTEALCQACDKAHRATKLTRNHKLITGDQLLRLPSGSQQLPAVMICEKHKLPIKYFCENDNEVFCNTCKLTSHRSCDTTDLGIQAIKTKPSHLLRDVKRQLSKLEKGLEQFEKRRTDDKVALKTQIEACFDELARIRQDINDTLDDLERKMRVEIKHAEETITKEIDDHFVIADDTLRQIRESIKLLTDSEKTQQDDVMFVAMMKTEVALPNYEKISADVQSEIQDIGIRLKPAVQIKAHLEKLKPFGELVHKESFLNLSVGKGTFHDLKCSACQSVIFLPDGHVLLACAEDGLKLLDRNFQIKSELSLRAVTACMVSDKEVLAAIGNRQAKVQFVEVCPSLVLKEAVSTIRHCSGVDFYNNEIYVACHDFPGNGEVRVLNREGQLKRRLGFDGKQYMFERPFGVKVTQNGERVLVADMDMNSVTCLDQQGGMIYRYTDTELKKPGGILLDFYDNLFICGKTNVHIVSKSGQKQRILFQGNGHITNIACISYRQTDGCLAIGMYKKDGKNFCILSTKGKAFDE